MKKALLLSHKSDYHAGAIAWGLEQIGISPTIWCLADLPDRGSISIALENGETRICLSNGAGKIYLDDYDFVWNRRIEKPLAPLASHPNDVKIIQTQNLHFINAFRASASLMKATINPSIFQGHANHKSLQLQQAVQVGLAVKPTIISNNLDEIMQFQKRHGEIVHKPLTFHNWREDGAAYAAYTSTTPELSEADRFSVEAVPLIYQSIVHAAYEVRLICFDSHFVACGFRNLSAERNIDLRKSMHERAVEYFEIDVPDETLTRCQSYMAVMGLRYGAFDFLVDQDGAWWFLECNESGQFLYLEAVLPTVPALRKFCFWISEIVEAGIAYDDRRLAALSITAFEEAGGRNISDEMTAHSKNVNLLKAEIALP